MPVIDQMPGGAGGSFRTPNALDQFLSQSEGQVAAALGPMVQVLHQYGVVKSKPHDTKSLQKPSWEQGVPAGDNLKVWGVSLPIGAVLTQCMVDESVSYRPYPLSDVTPVSIIEVVSASMEKIREKGTGGQPDTIRLGQSFRASAKKNKFQGSTSVAAANAAANEALNERSLQGTTLVEKQAAASAAGKAALAQTSLESGMFKLRSKLGKVFLGDPEPRRAELRFVVHDVVSMLDRGGQQLVRSRYEVLELLHSMFCDNPQGRAPYDYAYTILADAARLTASAVAGHLVKLSAPSLNPFHVDQWLVSSFIPVEVNTANVIAVRVKLVEFISALEARVTDPNTAPTVGETVPTVESPTRPSYTATAVPGATP